MRNKLIPYIGVLLFITNGCAEPLVASCAASNSEICGITNPADLAIINGAVGGEPVVGEQSAERSFVLALNANVDGLLGWLTVVDTVTNQASPVPWLPSPTQAQFGEANCKPPQFRRGRSFDLRKIDDGQWAIAMITDGAVDGARIDQRIEYLALVRDRAGWAVRWIGCVDVPAAYVLSDVAIGPTGNLFATHRALRESGLGGVMTQVRMMLGLDTGFVVVWNPDKGWAVVGNSAGASPSSVVIDPTGSVLFVGYAYNSSVARFDLLSGTRADTALPHRPESLTWTTDAETKEQALIATGASGVRLLSTVGCKNKAQPNCAYAFKVVQVDTRSLNVQPVYADDRQAIPGASVAVKIGQKLYLGRAAGDRMTVATILN